MQINFCLKKKENFDDSQNDGRFYNSLDKNREINKFDLVDVDDIFEEIKEDIPISATFEITPNCNFRCFHCYGKRRYEEKLLSTIQVKDIIDKLVEAGCLKLTITGGEPLTRPDFEEIYIYAREKGLFVSVCTNASLIDEKIVNLFTEYPVLNLSISIYGASETVFATFTQTKNQYEKVINGLNLIKNSDISFELKSVLTSINKGELHEMRALADSFDAYFRYSTKIVPGISLNSDTREYALSPEEALEFDLEDSQRLSFWKKIVSEMPEQTFSNRKRKEKRCYLCEAGCQSVAIDAKGMLQVCLMQRTCSYDLKNKTVKEGYNNFVVKERNRFAKKSYPCLDCEDFRFCEQCFAEISITPNFEFGCHSTCVLARKRHEMFNNMSS